MTVPGVGISPTYLVSSTWNDAETISKGWDAIMGFDLFILAILLFTTFRGAAKGVAWQLAGIAALVLCFLFATPLSLTIAPMIKLEAPLNRWVAMLAIYVVFSFGTFAVARGFREALEKAKFVEFDRHLGALFGLLKGVVIALVITFFAVAMSKKARDFILKTHTGYAAAHIMNAIDPVMPKELHAILEPYIHQLDAVDPALEQEREKHHDELNNTPNAPGTGTSKRPGRGGYRPTGPNADLLEGEDERAEPRDPFQDDDSEFNAPQAGSASNQSRLNDPAIEMEPDEPATTDNSIMGWLNELPHLAAKVPPAIKKQLHDAFENTLEEHRDEFLDTLRKTTPESVPQVARAWKNGRPRLQQQPTSSDDPFDVPPAPKFIRKPKPLPQPAIEPASGFDTDPNIDNGPTRIRPPSPSRIRQPGEPRTPQPMDDPETASLQRQELLRGIAKIFSSRQAEQAQKMTEIETLMLGLPDPVVTGVLDDWLADLRGADPDPDPHTDLSTNLNVRIARQVDTLNVPHNRLSPEWQAKLERFFKN